MMPCIVPPSTLRRHSQGEWGYDDDAIAGPIEKEAVGGAESQVAAAE